MTIGMMVIASAVSAISILICGVGARCTYSSSPSFIWLHDTNCSFHPTSSSNVCQFPRRGCAGFETNDFYPFSPSSELMRIGCFVLNIQLMCLIEPRLDDSKHMLTMPFFYALTFVSYWIPYSQHVILLLLLGLVHLIFVICLITSDMRRFSDSKSNEIETTMEKKNPAEFQCNVAGRMQNDVWLSAH